MKRLSGLAGGVVASTVILGSIVLLSQGAIAANNSYQIKETISAAFMAGPLLDIRTADYANPLVLTRAGSITTFLQKKPMIHQSKNVVSAYKNTLAILMDGMFVHKLENASSGLKIKQFPAANRVARLGGNSQGLYAPFQWAPTFTTSDTKLYSIFTAFDLGPKASPYNNPPYTPSNPNPPNNETGVGINITLSWSGGDPDGDVVRYDIYFGPSASPPLVASDVYESYYTVPTALAFNTQYWWRIVARDPEGLTGNSPVWTFTTMAGDTTPPISAITSPINGGYITTSTFTIAGTATDEAGGSGIQKVEVSVDCGVTWRPATGTDTWSYSWSIVSDDGAYCICSKATDNAGNEQITTVCVNITLDRHAPFVWCAGYWDTDISTSYGGPFTMIAAVLDDDVEEVEIYFAGEPTGAYLVDNGTQGDWVANDGLYTMAVSDVGPGVPPGQFMAEIVARDHAGNASMMWPYLQIYPTDLPAAPHKPADVQKLMQNLQNYLNFINRGPLRPKIMVGGYWDTFISTESGGNLSLLLYASDPDGDDDVINVELYYGGAPTGVYLSDDGPPLDWTAEDNLYMIISPVDPGLTADMFLVEGVARDSSGNVSHLYPYLTVEP